MRIPPKFDEEAIRNFNLDEAVIQAAIVAAAASAYAIPGTPVPTLEEPEAEPVPLPVPVPEPTPVPVPEEPVQTVEKDTAPLRSPHLAAPLEDTKEDSSGDQSPEKDIITVADLPEPLRSKPTPDEDRKLQSAAHIEPTGSQFLIPLAVPEGVSSGDERIFEKGSISVRDLPLPLRWQIVSDEGHKGSVVVGRIDSIERVEGGWGNARGVFDIGAYGQECERLVRGGFLRGVSVDVDKFEATQVQDEDGAAQFADKDAIKNQKIRIKTARLMGITVVPMPAFQEARIIIVEEPTLEDGDDVVEDGVYTEEIDDSEEEYSALVASAAPVVPPREWFEDPKLPEPTPIKVTDEGEVFGHIALWKADHIGMPGKIKPPRSASKYAYFRTGELRTTDGDVQVGQLTLAGGHANTSFNVADTVKHYDDTASAIVDVVAGEDKFGIWVRGALRPDVTPAQVRALRASAPSGDWRPINGRLELVAVCAVNVPGFMVPRAIVASAGGQVTALIAAGAAPLAEMKEESRIQRLEKRLASMEFALNEKRMNETLSRFSDFEEEEADNNKSRAFAAMQRLDTEFSTEPQTASAEQIAALMARFND